MSSTLAALPLSQSLGALASTVRPVAMRIRRNEALNLPLSGSAVHRSCSWRIRLAVSSLTCRDSRQRERRCAFGSQPSRFSTARVSADQASNMAWGIIGRLREHGPPLPPWRKPRLHSGSFSQIFFAASCASTLALGLAKDCSTVARPWDRECFAVAGRLPAAVGAGLRRARTEWTDNGRTAVSGASRDKSGTAGPSCEGRRMSRPRSKRAGASRERICAAVSSRGGGGAGASAEDDRKSDSSLELASVSSSSSDAETLDFATRADATAGAGTIVLDGAQSPSSAGSTAVRKDMLALPPLRSRIDRS
eukprot:scaffold82109_cov26-Tisochrysis_lutea.AAC.1